MLVERGGGGGPALARVGDKQHHVRALPRVGEEGLGAAAQLGGCTTQKDMPRGRLPREMVLPALDPAEDYLSDGDTLYFIIL